MEIVISYDISGTGDQRQIERVKEIRKVLLHDKNKQYPTNKNYPYNDGRIGLHPVHDRAVIYRQSLPGTALPTFGLGLITGRVEIAEETEDLKGDYERFPDLPRRKTVYRRKINYNEPSISKSAYLTIEDRVGWHMKADEFAEAYTQDSVFAEAIDAVFKEANLATNFARQTIAA